MEFRGTNVGFFCLPSANAQGDKKQFDPLRLPHLFAYGINMAALLQESKVCSAPFQCFITKQFLENENGWDNAWNCCANTSTMLLGLNSK